MTRGLAGALAVGALLWSTQAVAAATVLAGDGFAADCSRSARNVAASHPPHVEAIHECDLAIDTEVLTPHDLAGTLVNRGVLYMAAGDYALAHRDFDRAAAVAPDLGEAYVNRGAVMIAEHQDAAGIADIDRGLALNPDAPEKAYYNRAVGKERLHDLKGAYLDYLKASELKPDWTMPRTELMRFQVVRP